MLQWGREGNVSKKGQKSETKMTAFAPEKKEECCKFKKKAFSI